MQGKVPSYLCNLQTQTFSSLQLRCTGWLPIFLPRVFTELWMKNFPPTLLPWLSVNCWIYSILIILSPWERFEAMLKVSARFWLMGAGEAAYSVSDDQDYVSSELKGMKYRVLTTYSILKFYRWIKKLFSNCLACQRWPADLLVKMAVGSAVRTLRVSGGIIILIRPCIWHLQNEC